MRISAALEADRLLVSITDQGQGIDDAEQAYIFDKFYRGSRQRMLSGTGMGLAIAKAILRAHGGGIDVVSHRDQGATFTFWVPTKGGNTGLHNACLAVQDINTKRRKSCAEKIFPHGGNHVRIRIYVCAVSVGHGLRAEKITCTVRFHGVDTVPDKYFSFRA